MADISKPFPNWSELDRSIISAIAATQAVRATLDDSCHKRLRLLPATRTMSQPSPGQQMRPNPHEVAALCFEEVEWLLGEARVRMMIARAAVSGFSRTPAYTHLPPLASAGSVTSATSGRRPGESSTWHAFWDAREFITGATTAISRKIAKIFRKRVCRLLALIRNTRAGMRRRWWHCRDAFSGIGLFSSARVMKTRSHWAEQRSILRIVVLAAGAALAISMLTLGTTSSSPAAPTAGTVADDPALAESGGYPTSSCTPAAWGRACYL